MKSELEEWRPVVGYEGLYEVSSLGRVRSLDRYVNHPSGCSRITKGRVLKQRQNCKGYLYVGLHRDGKTKNAQVHRLVALAFVYNQDPENKVQVNHIDENHSNNRASNLEWMTPKENTNYGTGISRRANSQRNDPNQSKHINQYDLDGNYITTWPSLNEIGRSLGYDVASVSRCCYTNGSYHNSQWRFSSECEGNACINPYKKTFWKPVLQYTLDGEFVREWPCICEVTKELGFAVGNIVKCCKNIRPKAYGFIWKYSDL